MYRYFCIHNVLKKIRSVISEFAEVTLKDKGSSSEDKKLDGLAELVAQAKTNRDKQRFEQLVGNVFNIWFYSYVENFHCKPDTIQDMLGGIKYLLYTRGNNK